MREAIEQFRDAIRSAELEPPELIEPGKLHRFSTNGKSTDDAGWCKLFADLRGGVFGDHRSGLSEHWQAKTGRVMTQAEREAFQRMVAESKHQAELEERKRHEAAELKAVAILEAATGDPATHPYAVKKRVHLGALVKRGPWPQRGWNDALLVPIYAVDGRVQSIEAINADGDKDFLAGGKTAGGFHPFGKVRGADRVLIGEGLANVALCVAAEPSPAVAALSASNLKAAALAVRELAAPDAGIIILADNDVKPAGSNPGLRAAMESARSIGARVVIPELDGRKCDLWDVWNEHGIEAVKAAIASAQAPGRGEYAQGAQNAASGFDVGAAWPEPQPLAVKVAPEPYPIEALPDTIRAAVEEVAGFVKAPLPLVASSALAALSLAIQAHADVRRDEILFGPVGLFLMSIADSGERKTQADKMFTRPVLEYQDAQAEAAKPLLKDHKAAIDAWESKRAGIKDKIRQLAKDNKPLAGMESALRDLEHHKPEPPRVPKLMREDATPEGLAKKLQKEWPSAGVVSNEAGIVFGAHGMSKESVMRNLALLNKLWDGGRYQSDRGDEERSRDVRGARLTMGLMTQESTLRAFFDQLKGLARGTGFLARFLIAWPDSTMGTRFYSPPVAGSPALSAFNRRITALLNQPVPIDDYGILTPPMLPLTADAKAAWVEFHNAIEGELASGGELYDVRDVASKSADNAARLGALFQIFEHDTGGAVGLESFESASRIAAWHLNESRRFFGELALPAELANAARLDSWLIEYCRRERTHLVGKNHTRQHGPLRDGAALDAAIRELADLDRVRLVKEGKRLTIQVNSALVGVAT